jgi:hypothetical protein
MEKLQQRVEQPTYAYDYSGNDFPPNNPQYQQRFPHQSSHQQYSHQYGVGGYQTGNHAYYNEESYPQNPVYTENVYPMK